MSNKAVERSSTEREDVGRACVLMKPDIVNPGAPAARQYSFWDELVAIHGTTVERATRR